MFVTPERLPPSPPPVNFIPIRHYHQFMEWMECSDEMEPSEWGWKMEEDKLVSVLTDKSSAPDALTQMIHCNCLEGCNTLRCTCRKHGLECRPTSACRHYQDGNCNNMTNDPVIDDYKDDV